MRDLKQWVSDSERDLKQWLSQVVRYLKQGVWISEGSVSGVVMDGKHSGTEVVRDLKK